jgi:hypothetical protein
MPTRTLITRLSVAAIAATALAAPTAAHAGLTIVSRAQTTITMTERNDWQVVKPAEGGCAPIGGGSQVLRAQTAGTVSTLLTRTRADSHDTDHYRIDAPVGFRVERTDATEPGPPLTPEDTCELTPKDCRAVGLGGGQGGTSAVKGPFGRVSFGFSGRSDPVIDHYQHCWAPQTDLERHVNSRAVKVPWPKEHARFHGAHRLTVTRQLPAETIDDDVYGTVRNLPTVTFTLTYRIPRTKAGRCARVPSYRLCY